MNFIASEKLKENKEFSVSELSNLIRRTIDDNFGFITVRGEVSGFKLASSGHAYFNLKDANSILACTCWKPIFSRLNFKLEDGLEVLVSGRLSTFAGMSRYQLSAEKIEPAGSGALMELLNKRKEKLLREGLFDKKYKSKIPFFSSKIGVITSPVGSVIQDIIHRVKERFPVTIKLWPVAVQGEKCATDVANAIIGMNNLSEDNRPDVIIIARGGGSIEDLWGFNEEEVVRAAFESNIPIISAIGHETDFTLLDFVCDKRAPTPTAAAEFATPLKIDIEQKIYDLEKRSIILLNNIIVNFNNKIELVSSKISLTQRFFFTKQQKFDELSLRLESSLPNNLNIKESNLNSIKLPSYAILKLIEKKETNLNNLFSSSSIFLDKFFEKIISKFTLNIKLIDSMSIKQNLKRGFTIIRDDSGKIVKSKENAEKVKISEIEWFDGKIKIK